MGKRQIFVKGIKWLIKNLMNDLKNLKNPKKTKNLNIFKLILKFLTKLNNNKKKSIHKTKNE